MDTTMEAGMEMRELSTEEVARVDGGALPLLAIGLAFGRGALWGAGAVSTIEVFADAYELLTG